MGNCCAQSARRNVVLLLVGLDNAGKTVTVKGLAGEHTEDSVPTVGFSVISLKYYDTKVKIYDLGGGEDIRGIWPRYFVDAHGIIFVIDSSDYSRLDEAKNVLKDLLSHHKISGKPVLLLANKQDSLDALDEIDLAEKLELEKLVNEKKCPTLLETSSAKSKKIDPGIKNGYQWLMNTILRDYEEINSRVLRDVEEEKVIFKEKRRFSKVRSFFESDENSMEVMDDPFRPIDEIIAKNKTKIRRNNSAMSSKSYLVNRKKIEANRPKSAVDIVKRQLVKNNRRSSILSILPTNKTAPVSLFTPKLAHNSPISHDRVDSIESSNSYLFTPKKTSKQNSNFVRLGSFDTKNIPNTSRSLNSDDFSSKNMSPKSPKTLPENFSLHEQVLTSPKSSSRSSKSQRTLGKVPQNTPEIPTNFSATRGHETLVPHRENSPVKSQNSYLKSDNSSPKAPEIFTISNENYIPPKNSAGSKNVSPRSQIILVTPKLPETDSNSSSYSNKGTSQNDFSNSQKITSNMEGFQRNSNVAESSNGVGDVQIFPNNFSNGFQRSTDKVLDNSKNSQVVSEVPEDIHIFSDNFSCFQKTPNSLKHSGNSMVPEKLPKHIPLYSENSLIKPIALSKNYDKILTISQPNGNGVLPNLKNPSFFGNPSENLSTEVLTVLPNSNNVVVETHFKLFEAKINQKVPLKVNHTNLDRRKNFDDDLDSILKDVS